MQQIEENRINDALLSDALNMMYQKEVAEIRQKLSAQELIDSI